MTGADERRPLTVVLLVSFLIGRPLLAHSQTRSSVTLTQQGVTLKVYLRDSRITMGGVFLLSLETTLPGDITVPVIQADLPEHWSRDLIYLSDISDAEAVWIGNQQFTKITRVYRLQPLRPGTIRFSGLRVSVPPATFTVPTLTGYVVSGGGLGPEQPLPEKPLRVEATANPRQPYLGQQVVYTLRLAVSPFVDLEPSPNYEPPQAEGFFAEDFPKVLRSFSGGYDVQSVRMAFFPLRSESLTIGSARVLARISGEPGIREMRTEPIRIRVRPLPQPLPAGFTNLVGRLEANLEVFPSRVPVGETLTVRLTLRGTAYLPALPTPDLSVRDTRIPPPRQAIRREVGPTGLLWFVRSFTWRIVPLKEGDLTIPPFRFPYLDPNGGIYRTAQTRPVTISVVPGSVPAAVGSETRPPKRSVQIWLLTGLGSVVALSVAGLLIYRRQKWLAQLGVDDPDLKQAALLLKREGPQAVGEGVRQWMREQIYQRTGILVSPAEKPERLLELLTRKGVSEAGARFASDVWARSLTSLNEDEALHLLRRAGEVPRRL